jgi:DNA-binding MarR family transcriptional regulator
MTAQSEAPAGDGVLIALARAMLRGRRIWPQWLGPLPTGDAGWAILLELFVARRSDREVTVGDVAVLLGIPSTTSLRYIDELQHRGHLVRVPDEDDRRRVHLAITPATELTVVAALADFRRLFTDALSPAA